MIRDDGDDESTNENIETLQLNERVLELMRRNDPQIKGLQVSFYDSHREADIQFRHINAHKVDWAKMGEFIANSTHIKSLFIQGWRNSLDGEENCKALYKAIARNRSLNSLDLCGCSDVNFGDGVEILDPFFKHNNNLRFLSIGDGSMPICNGSAKLLAAALSNCASSLHNFDIICWELGDMSAGKIISSLAAHSELKTLSFCLELGIVSCIELSKLLRISNSKLELLDLRGCKIVDEGAIALGGALGESSSLKKLSLEDMGEVTSVGWGSLVRCLSNPECSLEEINLNTEDSEHDIDDRVMPILANSLSNNTKLKGLEISCNHSITNIGWQRFSGILRLSTSSLENIDFSYGAIDDIAVMLLVDEFANMSSLKSLRLNGNDFITSLGWKTISSLLPRSPNCSLVNLQLGNNSNRTNVNDEVISSFANNLMNNNTLQTLKFGIDRNAITSSGWKSLEKTLCNDSTIESIINSNHTLHKAHYPHLSFEVESHKFMSYNLECILKMNENRNKVEVIRQKIILYHFINGKDSIETFIDMELEVLPSAIGWIGRDDIGLSLLYNLFKSMPALFDKDRKTAGSKRTSTELLGMGEK